MGIQSGQETTERLMKQPNLFQPKILFGAVRQPNALPSD
jgi:hypothetical protein